MNPPAIVLIAALCLDLAIGDPEYSLHPVRLMGRLIESLELKLRSWGLDGFFGGALLAAWVIAASTVAVMAAHLFFWRVHPWSGFCFDVYALYSSICLGDLVKHGKRVAKALLAGDLSKARRAVQFMVGRDAEKLDAHGVGRAAVESVAESFVDGFASPVFWFAAGCLLSGFLSDSPLAGGVAAAVVFRAVNTMDSMIGYKNDRYRYFGRFAAKLDDAANFIPARLSIPVIALSALAAGLDGQNALGVGMRDRLKHPSPNSAHAESAVAGALNVRLGGPGHYSYGLVEKPWLGDGTKKATHSHLLNCLLLIRLAGVLLALLAAGLLHVFLS